MQKIWPCANTCQQYAHDGDNSDKKDCHGSWKVHGQTCQTCQSARFEAMGQLILNEYAECAESARQTIEFPLKQAHRQPGPKQEEESGAKAAPEQAQNHPTQPSETDKDDVGPCDQHTFEHQQDPSKQDQKEPTGPIKTACEQKNQ